MGPVSLRRRFATSLRSPTRTGKSEDLAILYEFSVGDTSGHEALCRVIEVEAATSIGNSTAFDSLYQTWESEWRNHDGL